MWRRGKQPFLVAQMLSDADIVLDVDGFGSELTARFWRLQGVEASGVAGEEHVRDGRMDDLQ